MPVIDAHHHFWTYSPAEYGWIGESMSALQRDFLAADLAVEIEAAGVDGVISVQARQTIAETEWLLSLAETNAFIYGVVGWAPLADHTQLRSCLHAWLPRPKLLALRHVLQDEPDDRHMLRPDFDGGLTILAEHRLPYDILIYERQLPGAIEMVDRHPAMTFILDHVAKPKIAIGQMQPWKDRIAALARRPNVYCKVSAMATEADWATWTADQLRPYFDAVLEAFGPSRLMFGSDWPVCLAASPYLRWAHTVREWTTALSASEQERIWGGTAIEAYRIGPR